MIPLIHKPDAMAGLFVLLVSLLAVGGWIANIVKLVGADAIAGMEAARIVGIAVVPLGSILGFL